MGKSGDEVIPLLERLPQLVDLFFHRLRHLVEAEAQFPDLVGGVDIGSFVIGAGGDFPAGEVQLLDRGGQQQGKKGYRRHRSDQDQGVQQQVFL